MDQTQALITNPTMNIRQGVFDDSSKFELAQRIGNCLVTSTMVPERYRGKENLGNVMIALDLAARIGLPPLMVMQHLYVVYGTPGWSGQMVTALINGSKLFKEPLEYEMKGTPGKDDWGCRCYAETQTGKKVFGPWVDIAMAKAEGWYDRKDKDGRAISKWRTIPEMMMRYRAAAYFGRTVCPDVTIGLRTVDEEEEIAPQGTVIDVADTSEKSAEASAAVPTLAPVSEPRLSAPTRMKRVKAAVPTKPVPEPEPTVKPAHSPEPSTPPEAVSAPTQATPEPEQEEEERPHITQPTIAPQQEEEKKALTLNEMATEIGQHLANANVTVDDFFDWIKASGRAQRYRCDPDSIAEIAELPPKLLVDLVGGDIKACIRTMAPR